MLNVINTQTHMHESCTKYMLTICGTDRPVQPLLADTDHLNNECTRAVPCCIFFGQLFSTVHRIRTHRTHGLLTGIAYPRKYCENCSHSHFRSHSSRVLYVRALWPQRTADCPSPISIIPHALHTRLAVVSTSLCARLGRCSHSREHT